MAVSEFLRRFVPDRRNARSRTCVRQYQTPLQPRPTEPGARRTNTSRGGAQLNSAMGRYMSALRIHVGECGHTKRSYRDSEIRVKPPIPGDIASAGWRTGSSMNVHLSWPGSLPGGRIDPTRARQVRYSLRPRPGDTRSCPSHRRSCTRVPGTRFHRRCPLSADTGCETPSRTAFADSRRCRRDRGFECGDTNRIADLQIR
jgi:hypothetical protein